MVDFAAPDICLPRPCWPAYPSVRRPNDHRLSEVKDKKDPQLQHEALQLLLVYKWTNEKNAGWHVPYLFNCGFGPVVHVFACSFRDSQEMQMLASFIEIKRQNQQVYSTVETGFLST